MGGVGQLKISVRACCVQVASHCGSGASLQAPQIYKEEQSAGMAVPARPRLETKRVARPRSAGLRTAPALVLMCCPDVRQFSHFDPGPVTAAKGVL